MCTWSCPGLLDYTFLLSISYYVVNLIPNVAYPLMSNIYICIYIPCRNISYNNQKILFLKLY